MRVKTARQKQPDLPVIMRPAETAVPEMELIIVTGKVAHTVVRVNVRMHVQAVLAAVPLVIKAVPAVLVVVLLAQRVVLVALAVALLVRRIVLVALAAALHVQRTALVVMVALVVVPHVLVVVRVAPAVAPHVLAVARAATAVPAVVLGAVIVAAMDNVRVAAEPVRRVVLLDAVELAHQNV